MRVIDAGHHYALDTLDGDGEKEHLRFVKRVGPGYPGNEGSYPGTNIQEVLRVLIDRVEYLNQQIPDVTNVYVLRDLRDAIWQLEVRAARRHGRKTPLATLKIETQETCLKCGHMMDGAVLMCNSPKS